MSALRAASKAFAALAGLGIIAAGPVALAGPKAATGGLVAQMRASTDRFHNIANAEAAGYVPFRDVNGVSCIAMPGMGAMGVHYVNPSLIADPAIDPRKPEALVYAPGSDGTLHLAALEYLVDKAAWNGTHAKPPRLFAGMPFNRTGAPNRFGLAPFYSQHVWVWKHNPAGLTAMWNPNVNCRLAR